MTNHEITGSVPLLKIECESQGLGGERPKADVDQKLLFIDPCDDSRMIELGPVRRAVEHARRNKLCFETDISKQRFEQTVEFVTEPAPTIQHDLFVEPGTIENNRPVPMNVEILERNR